MKRKKKDKVRTAVNAAEAPQKRKIVFLRMVLSVGGLILVFSGLEIYFRYFYEGTDSFGLSRATIRWIEKHYRYNTSKFRDSIEYRKGRETGKRRITFVGDSFTAGHGIPNVEDRFANRIRAMKKDAWEVHALAKNGIDLGREMELLKSTVEHGYRPDQVVLVYCLNDISDILPEWRRILDRIYGETRRPPFLIQKSEFANIVYFRFKALNDPDISNYYQFVRSGYSGPTWDRQKERLKSLRDFCLSNGGNLSVVIFPFMQHLGPEYEHRPTHEKLNLFFKEIGVPCLDLLPVFEQQSDRKLYVSVFDAHPNLRAHRIAAESITPFIESVLQRPGSENF